MVVAIGVVPGRLVLLVLTLVGGCYCCRSWVVVAIDVVTGRLLSLLLVVAVGVITRLLSYLLSLGGGCCRRARPPQQRGGVDAAGRHAGHHRQSERSVRELDDG